jgi:hypothetical protein
LETAKGVSKWAADGVHLAAAATRIAARSLIAGIESTEDADPELKAKRQQRR